MIKYTKIREVKNPIRSTSRSGGIDFFVPNFTDNYITAFNARNTNARSMCFYDTNNKNLHIHPQGQILIPLGIKVEIPKGYILVAMNKSGVSFDQRLVKSAELVDEDYRDELFASLYNYSAFPTIIKEGQKILQFVLIPVQYDEMVEVVESDLHIIPTERTGGMGSTGLF
jgi:deoxyuridine 5'-triphosphate nucleotidohydrolase